MKEALDIWVKGTVQGVGFRPFVYRMAKRYLIDGWVMNSIDGVHIHAEGESNLLDEFVMALTDEAPAASHVTEIEMHEAPLEPFDSFEIRFSDDADTDEITSVSPDLAICADCERELFDPENRRYRYPFINCTNCGPRFTIIDKLPYDRANTAMRDFEMCDACQHEYDDPADRRFHAQPNACFDCGPRVAFVRPDGTAVESSDEAFAKTVEALLDGEIIAIKGLGGYHLACNANDEAAVLRLRKRKGRDGKPFAVMAASLDDVREICNVNDAEAKVLSGVARPIVLLQKRTDAKFAKGLADGLAELGVMLPYTPVQMILLHDFKEAWVKRENANTDADANAAKNEGESSNETPLNEIPLLVMTSGNLHDEPIAIGNDEAKSRLSGIADAFLENDRDILTRFDDSVLRVLDFGKGKQDSEEACEASGSENAGALNASKDDDQFALQMIRRSRGYAPSPITVPKAQHVPSMHWDTEQTDPTIFAAGPEQKNTFCFLREGEAMVSQHIGDVENVETFDAWLDAKARFEGLFDLEAQALACDMHPEYLTSKWAHEKANIENPAKPLVEVQHHHAHIVAAMAESEIDQAVCGIAFDGTGFGVDGNIWGGEVLISNLKDFERFANFAYVPMPGGAAAIKEPLRMAYGVLWEFDLLDHPAAQAVLENLGKDQVSLCEKMIDQGLNTPVSSSVGRLFDAASAILGVCTHPTYEGEAAILLEACMSDAVDANTCNDPAYPIDSAHQINSAYPIDIIKNTATESSTAEDTSVVLMDAKSLFSALLDDMAAGIPTPEISKRFHNAFVSAIVNIATLCHGVYGMNKVVLTGGVFMNRYLTEHTVPALQRAGFDVILNRELPPNDGCVSLGQAVVAAHRLCQ